MSDTEEGENPDDETSTAEAVPVRQTSGNPELLDRTFQILGAARRRYALYYLQDQGSCDVDDIARHIVGLEDDSSPRDDTSLRRAKSHLVHNDLPRLLATDFIEYNERTGIVRLSNPPAFFGDLLDVVATFDQPGISR